MNEIPLGALIGALLLLVVLSAFFSAAEIGLMTLNRYRLRHLAESGKYSAKLAVRLLERPDRLLGIILLGNNFANIAASSIATILGFRAFGEPGIAFATGLLTLAILIFAEVAPKTLAALHPERVAFASVYLLKPLLFLLYPFVWLVNIIANRFLQLFGVPLKKKAHELTTEELKAVVMEAGSLIPESHQTMLLAILDLEKVTVEDVMVPRGEMEGIDIDAEWDEIQARFATTRFTRMPVYRGTLDNIVGISHVRSVLNLMQRGRLNRDAIIETMIEPYYVPAGTQLHTQLLNFRQSRRRMGLVVDEYGDVLGLVTIEEILEEIVGDFTSQTATSNEDLHPQDDGSYLVNGSTPIRELNRRLGWELPITGPKTINGLITEYLEDLPQPGTSLAVNRYQIDIVRTRGTAVQVARLRVLSRESTQTAGTEGH